MITDNDESTEKGFWRRQFSIKTTSGQIVFDVIAGIVLPVLCLVFDPVVFRPIVEGATSGLFTKYQMFAYVGIAFALFALTLWLLLGKHVKSWAGLLTGVFFISTIFACGIGIALFPYSLVGTLFLGIGILGFVPFLTAFVFFRNGTRTLQVARQTTTKSFLAGMLVIGTLIIITIPLYTQWQIEKIVPQSIEQILFDDTKVAAKAEQRLYYLRIFFPEYVELITRRVTSWPIQKAISGTPSIQSQDIQRFKHIAWCVTCFDSIVFSYAREKDETRQQLLASLYEEITGNELKDRLYLIND